MLPEDVYKWRGQASRICPEFVDDVLQESASMVLTRGRCYVPHVAMTMRRDEFRRHRRHERYYRRGCHLHPRPCYIRASDPRLRFVFRHVTALSPLGRQIIKLILHNFEPEEIMLVMKLTPARYQVQYKHATATLRQLWLRSQSRIS